MWPKQRIMSWSASRPPRLSSGSLADFRSGPGHVQLAAGGNSLDGDEAQLTVVTRWKQEGAAQPLNTLRSCYGRGRPAACPMGWARRGLARLANWRYTGTGAYLALA